MVDEMAGSRTRGRAPWHLWVVGLLAILWNGFGAYDHTMTISQGDAYLRPALEGMDWKGPQIDAYIAYYHAMPAWMMAVWVIGVWGGVLGGLLLLLRRRWATPVFVVSLAAFLVSVLYTYVLSNGAEVSGAEYPFISAVIAAVGVLEILYSRWMARRGVLR